MFVWALGRRVEPQSVEPSGRNGGVGGRSVVDDGDRAFGGQSLYNDGAHEHETRKQVRNKPLPAALIDSPSLHRT